MNILELNVDELIPYENNPRKNDEAVEKVALSISAFGFKVPIVIDKNNVIVTGHTRLKAAKKLGITTVPCIMADDLTEEQIKAFRLADNKVSEFSEWDEEKLMKELDELEMDMSLYGFESLEAELEEISEENPYSKGVKIPQYEPTGEDVPLSSCYDDTKANELIQAIESSEVPEEIKTFLRLAAMRHIVFNFKNIAEFYANASAEVQELMEQSALVIIDINDALANGYVKLSKTVEELLEYEK